MMKSWSDGKKFLFEDLVVYISVFACNIAADHLFNLGIALGLLVDRSQSTHPYSLGALQIGILAFCAVQIARKLSQWRYWC